MHDDKTVIKIHMALMLARIGSLWATAMTPAEQRQVDGRLASYIQLAQSEGQPILARLARRDRRQLRRELARSYQGRKARQALPLVRGGAQ